MSNMISSVPAGCGPKETLARRALNREWGGRAPLYDLWTNDAVISYYAGETLTLQNAEDVVYRALSRGLDASRAVILPRSEMIEKTEDGSIWDHRRWTSWLQQSPVTSYDEYLAALRRSCDELSSDWSARDQTNLDTVLASYRAARARLGDFLLVGNLGTKAGFMALFSPNFLEYMGYALGDDPELVARVFEANTHKSVQKIEHLPVDWGQLCPAVFVGEDMAYKTAPMVSPAFMRRAYWPCFERIVAAYHARGVKVIFHSDGNLWPVLADLAATGVDGLNPIEVAAGMTPADIRRRYPHLLLFGGISYSGVLAHGTPEQVAEATRDAIRRSSPGYFVGTDTELGDDIPLVNALAMYETAWQVQG